MHFTLLSNLIVTRNPCVCPLALFYICRNWSTGRLRTLIYSPSKRQNLNVSFYRGHLFISTIAQGAGQKLRIPFLGVECLGKYSCEEIGRYQRMLNSRYVQLNLHLMEQTGTSMTNWKCRKEETEKQLAGEGIMVTRLSKS